MFTDDNHWLILKQREEHKENSRDKRRKSILKRLNKKKERAQYENSQKRWEEAQRRDSFRERDIRNGSLITDYEE